MKQTILTMLTTIIAATAQADGHKRHHRERDDDNHNYIIERQTNYQVPSGSTPSDRLIIGKREIDVYSNGQMFEGDHMVGDQHR
jgi:hypothetical protein